MIVAYRVSVCVKVIVNQLAHAAIDGNNMVLCRVPFKPIFSLH